jgi:hypothetical protein
MKAEIQLIHFLCDDTSSSLTFCRFTLIPVLDYIDNFEQYILATTELNLLRWA